MCGICGRPPRDKISKTALGAENNISWEYHRQVWRLIDKLRKEGMQIVALEQDEKSINLNKFKPQFPMALVVGNEINGVSKSVLDRADKIVEIPMYGKKESLNVAVSFGIAGYLIKFCG